MPNVKIRIERGDTGRKDISGTKTDDKSSKNVAIQSLFANQIYSTTKQIISYAASNVGNFTGNYVEQDRINQMLEVLGDVSGVVMGAMSGGWAGAIIAISTLATKKGIQAITEYRADVLSQREINIELARSGNSTINGSRGTEN